MFFAKLIELLSKEEQSLRIIFFALRVSKNQSRFELRTNKKAVFSNLD